MVPSVEAFFERLDTIMKAQSKAITVIQESTTKIDELVAGQPDMGGVMAALQLVQPPPTKESEENRAPVSSQAPPATTGTHLRAGPDQ